MTRGYPSGTTPIGIQSGKRSSFGTALVLIVCIIGDGEAETGPPRQERGTATNSSTLPPTGAVLPILHLNQIEIANSTVFGSMNDEKYGHCSSATAHTLSHQVLVKDVKSNPYHLRVLEHWLRWYWPWELFDEGGRPQKDILAQWPAGNQRMALNPHAQAEKFEAACPPGP